MTGKKDENANQIIVETVVKFIAIFLIFLREKLEKLELIKVICFLFLWVIKLQINLTFNNT